MRNDICSKIALCFWRKKHYKDVARTSKSSEQHKSCANTGVCPQTDFFHLRQQDFGKSFEAFV